MTKTLQVLGWAFFMFFWFGVSVSCTNKDKSIEPITNYPDAIVKNKDINALSRKPPEMTIELYDSVNGDYYFKLIYLTSFDFNKYAVGDTLK